MRKFSAIIAAIVAFAFAACGSASAKTEQAAANQTNDTTMTEPSFNPADTSSVKVEVNTTLGSFTILLYGDTPRHRDNFVKHVKEGYYDGTLFHRVINQFMIQAGDPDSKNAAPGQRLGAGGPDYTLEAEIIFPKHFHKRGALAAARQGDQVNPQKRSSGSQFYVVTGRKMIPAQIDALASQLKNQQLQSTFNGLAAEHMADIRKMQAEGDSAGLKKLQEELIAQTEATVAAHPIEITDEMKEAYTTVGGAPHLDGAYTVFGEVLEGMDVIDKIEKAETDGSDRPKEDIRILSMKLL
ncbi:MAG: peptidylprolyl isomerase [Muribaculaceae bacterium]|nr:peptidylprolyl isomerase [Muribaculaceae bacterium]MCI9053972.1 peptidylprolyl isomerase [Muribaculaceae bacterium]